MTEYYVHATDGDDNNSGLAGSPWASIYQVTSQTFSPGDIIHFARGEQWDGTLHITESGTESEYITFRDYGDIALDPPVIVNPDSNHSAYLEGSRLHLMNFTIHNTIDAGVSSPGNYNRIENCEIYDTGYGVEIHGDNCYVYNCEIHDLNMVTNTETPTDDDDGAACFLNYGNYNDYSWNTCLRCRAVSEDYGYDGGVLELYGSGNNGVIFHHNYAEDCNGVVETGGGSVENLEFAHNVLVHNYGRFGTFHLEDDSSYPSSHSNLRFLNNTMIEDGTGEYTGFWWGGSIDIDQIIFRNNIFWKRDSQLFPESGPVVSHNCYYMLDGASIGLTPGTGSVQGNPDFADFDNGDYHLTSASPCIDAGTSVDLTYAWDRDERLVPQGSAMDMGAYEYPEGGTAGTIYLMAPTARGYSITPGATLIVPQWLRPSSDVILGNWVDEASATSSIYDGLDEHMPADSDFARSGSTPSNDAYVVRLGAGGEPANPDGPHVVTYRYYRDGTAEQVDLTVELRQGYVDETSQGTLVASWTHYNISTETVTTRQTLTSTQRGNITDYSDLYLRFVANAP